jgi:23S rRNA (pseudouridine1915-N3)-methyltransferase
LKIQIAAIGLLKAGPEQELAAEYRTRIEGLGRKAGISGFAVSDWPESRAAEAKLRMAEEAKLLWGAVPAGTPTVALDERGRAMTSAEFASFIGRQAEQGAKSLTFLIGGPDGHDAETREKATKLLALGPMTWPHRLVRAMLLEQIYRAVTILVNHPYHRA